MHHPTWRREATHRAAYGLALVAAAALTLAAAFFVHPVAGVDRDPDGTVVEQILKAPWMLGAVLVGSFVSGALTWRPARDSDPLMDTVWLIANTVGLSFWAVGLAGGVALAFLAARPRSVELILIDGIFGGIFGAMLFGPLAYPIGGLVIALSRWAERRLGRSYRWPDAVPDGWLLRGARVVAAVLAVAAAAISFYALLWLLTTMADAGREYLMWFTLLFA